mgnify:CR=1 FL=1
MKLKMLAKEFVRENRNLAWENYLVPIKKQIEHTADLSANLVKALTTKKPKPSKNWITELSSNREPNRRDVMHTLHRVLTQAGDNDAAFWTRDYYNELKKKIILYTILTCYNEGPKNTLNVTRA